MNKRLIRMSADTFKVRFGSSLSRTNTIVKNRDDCCGVICFPKAIHLPKDCIGKKVEVLIKIMEDENGI